MNVQAVQLTTAISTQTAITVMDHSIALVEVGTEGMEAAALVRCT